MLVLLHNSLVASDPTIPTRGRAMALTRERESTPQDKGLQQQVAPKPLALRTTLTACPILNLLLVLYYFQA